MTRRDPHRPSPSLMPAAVACLLLAALVAGAAAPPTPRGDPLKAVVFGSDVVTCVLGDDIHILAHIHPLDAARPAVGRRCALNSWSPVRWQLGRGAMWVGQDFNGGPSFHPPEIAYGVLMRIDLSVFLRQGEDIDNRPESHFHCETPAGWFSFLAGDLRYYLYTDYLPASGTQARQFVATNLTSKRADRENDFAGGKSPRAVFLCYLGASRFDPKKRTWSSLPAKLEWSTPVAFQEPFQVLGIGNDFYFVTRSGSVYRAAKPAKGTDRTLTRVYDGAKRPVVSFVTDAATNRSFLFVRPAKAGGRPAFFELSDKPELVEYDPAAAPVPKIDEPHRTAVHNARVLVALKKITGKPLVDPEPEPKGGR